VAPKAFTRATQVSFRQCTAQPNPAGIYGDGKRYPSEIAFGIGKNSTVGIVNFNYANAESGPRMRIEMYVFVNGKGKRLSDVYSERLSVFFSF
jgi:hypothetical protein